METPKLYRLHLAVAFVVFEVAKSTIAVTEVAFVFD